MGIRERWKGFKPLPEDIKARILKLAQFFERGKIFLAYLFGSLAKGDHGEDIDLAILPSENNLDQVREKLESELGTQRIHLVNLKSAPPTLKFEIISQGILIYKKDDLIENEFELSSLREYQDRKPIREKQYEILKERTKIRWS